MSEHQFEDLGKDPDGNKVTAATDSAGPQVIVKGEEVHFLSTPLKDHAAAVELGKRVVAEGMGCHKGWFNLKEDLFTGMMAVFGGTMRGGHVTDEMIAEDQEKINEGHKIQERLGMREG